MPMVFGEVLGSFDADEFLRFDCSPHACKDFVGGGGQGANLSLAADHTYLDNILTIVFSTKISTNSTRVSTYQVHSNKLILSIQGFGVG